MKILKKICCKIGWHSIFVGFDNIQKDKNDPLQFLIFAQCKWCGYKGQIDSHGELF